MLVEDLMPRERSTRANAEAVFYAAELAAHEVNRAVGQAFLRSRFWRACLWLWRVFFPVEPRRHPRPRPRPQRPTPARSARFPEHAAVRPRPRPCYSSLLVHRRWKALVPL